MRGLLAAGVATIAAFQSPARAGVSDDLVFCSKLTSAKERISCYDAAARIAANAGRIDQTPQRRPAPATPSPITTQEVAAHPVSTLERTNPFQGLYAAIGGSYGFSSPRSAHVFSSNFVDFSDTLTAKGTAGRATLGYNATIGHFLFGTEIAGRFGNEAVSGERTALVTPSSIFPTFGTEVTSYRIENNAGVHIAARAGFTFDQTLVFMRAGVGASHVVETAVRDQRGLTFCTFTPSLGCTFGPGALVTASKTNWVPSALLGVGIEQNFGPFFARAEGEIEVLALHQTTFPIAIAGASAEAYWFARVMASVGVRF
jgi:hypothetical protein